MRLCRRMITVSLALAVSLTAARPTAAHEPTANRFQRERALAVAQVLKTSEQAPRAGGAADSCRLTMELRIGDNPAPVAGLIRIVNLDSGKPLAFSDEILRDKNWYVVA